ncbi:hypothetical protein ABID65_005004 [Bradyrhizobium sp. S3.9.2]
MKLFAWSKPMKKLEVSLAASRKRFALLGEKRLAAKAALDAAQMRRLKYLHEGDLADEKLGEKLQLNVDTASSVLAGLDEAIGVLQTQIDAAENDLNAHREREEREKVADEISTAADAAMARVEPALTGMRDLAQALSEIDHLGFEVLQLAQYLRGAAGEVELAIAVVLPEVRQTANRIKSSEVAIPHRATATVEPVIAAGPEVRRVFVMRSVKWKDAEGRQQFAKQYEDADLPPATADKAMRSGAVCALDDPRRKTLKGVRGGEHVDTNASDVLDLDALEGWSGARHTGASPAAQAVFTPFNRGPERKIMIEVPRQ